MSQALYRKWRPAQFQDVIGQEHVIHTLLNAISFNRVGHAFLFSGPRGTGKTTTARLLAKAVNCLQEDVKQRPDDTCRICQSINNGRFLDLIEIDAASNTGVDDIRSLRDKINFAPNEGRFKVYIIDEVHMLSIAAFNALLKTLEEPPPHAKFVLATTEEHKVPITIKSRCQVYQFRLLTINEIRERLQWLVNQEQLKIEEAALDLIARQGAGSLRDAESLLDQLVTIPSDTITLEYTQRVLGTASMESVYQLSQALLVGDGATGLQVIHQALSVGTDVRQFARQMVSYLRDLLLLQTAGNHLTLGLTDEEQKQLQTLVQHTSRSTLVAAIKQFTEAATTMSNSWQPQLALELALIESLPSTQTVLNEVSVSKPIGTQMPMVGHTARELEISEASKMPAVSSASSTPSSQLDTHELSTPEQAPSTPMSRTTTTLTLSHVIDKWPYLMGQMRKQDRNLSALLSSCKPLAMEGNIIILGFDFLVLKEKFDSHSKAAHLVAKIATDTLQVPCTVRAVITKEYTPLLQAPSSISKKDFVAFAKEIGGVIIDNS